MERRSTIMIILLATTIISGFVLHVHGGQTRLVIHMVSMGAFTLLTASHIISHNGFGHRRGGMTQETAHIRLDPHKCKACWKCVEGCPKGVLDKVDMPLHKHSRIVNPDACIGCKKCVKNCEYGALTSKE